MPKKRQRLDPVLRDPPPKFPGPPVSDGTNIIPANPRNGETKAVLKRRKCIIYTHWKDGKKNGPETIVWPEEPEKLQRQMWKDDVKDGFFTLQDERLRHTATYVNGVKNGLDIAHFAEGHLIATPYVNGVKHGLSINRIQDATGCNIRVGEWKDGVLIDDKWVSRSLENGVRPGEVADERRREAFGQLTTAIEEAELPSGAYKNIYDAAQVLHNELV